MTLKRRTRYAALVSALLLVFLAFTLGPTLARFDYAAIGTRGSWQLPEKVVQSLALKPGAVVADIGAGDGYFTFLLAKAVSDSGWVFAVEIDSAIVNGLRSAAERKGMTNVEVVLAKVDNPELPDGMVDLAFFCNVYHHIEGRESYFRALRQDLAPGGRVAIIEMTSQAPIEWIGHRGHGTSLETLQREMHAAGYRVVKLHEFLPLQNFAVFESAE